MNNLGQRQIEEIQKQDLPTIQEQFDYNQLNTDILTPVPTSDYQNYDEQKPFDVTKIDYTPVVPLQGQEVVADDFSKQLQELQGGLVGESAFQAEQENLQGLPALQETQTDLTSQLKGLVNEAQSIPLQLQQESIGRGITKGGLAPIQTAQLRNNAIKALSVNSLLEATRGNISTALDLADRAVAQKYDPIKEKIASVTKNLEIIRDSESYSADQRKRAQGQLDIQNAKLKQVEEEEKMESDIQNVAIQAAQFGVDSLTLRKIQNAENLVEANQIASDAGVFVSAGEQFTLTPGQTRFDENGNIIATAIAPESIIGEKIANLTPTQRSQAGVLAKQLYGTIRTKDQIEQFLNPILERVASGESIDDIADSLRLAGQSVEFTGILREAGQQITADWTDKKTQTTFDKLDDLISSGNIVATQDFLKKIALDDSGVEQAKQIMGQERTVEFLDEIASDLKKYEDGGGDTNIFTGTLEEISRKAGLVKDSELRKIAVKITKARQQYRRSMTGVAFSEGEDLEYDRIFPDINKTAEFNTAVISGLQESFRGDVDFFYGHKMGTDAYDQIFKQDVLFDKFGKDFANVQDWLDTNPTNQETILNTIREQGLDEAGSLQLINRIRQRSTFNSVGGDTNSAIITKVDNKKDGSKGGQCGRFVNNLTGLGVGDSFNSKMAKMDKTIKEPAPGMVFTMPYKNTGHCGIIVDINNGIATVKDSNWSLDEKVKTHKIAVSKMAGFKRV